MKHLNDSGKDTSKYLMAVEFKNGSKQTYYSFPKEDKVNFNKVLDGFYRRLLFGKIINTWRLAGIWENPTVCGSNQRLAQYIDGERIENINANTST